MLGRGKIDGTLGIYHALENRKNLILMVASFAFSILMFMSFSGLIDFMKHAIRPLQPWSPDISLVSPCLFRLPDLRRKFPVQAEYHHFHKPTGEKMIEQFFVIKNSFLHTV